MARDTGLNQWPRLKLETDRKKYISIFFVLMSEIDNWEEEEKKKKKKKRNK